MPDTSNSSYGTVSQLQQDLYKSISRSSQDLHTRTSYDSCLKQDFNRISTKSQGPAPDHASTPGGFHQNLFKGFSQGPVQDHARAFDSISLGSPQDLRTRKWKDPEQDLHARTRKRTSQISQDRQKWTCCCWSGSDKILIQEPPTRAFIQAPLRHGISKLLTQGPLREDLTRISTRSSVKGLYSVQDHARTS